MSNNTAFVPVKCTEETIQNTKPVNGHLYFATDSQKIYLGTNNEFVAMGGSGNSNIFYATKVFAEEDSAASTYSFIPDDIDGNKFSEIEVDSLILNIPNGCFYRVIEIKNESELIARKVTSAGGSGGPTNLPPVITDLDDNNTYFSASDVDNMKITFSSMSQAAKDNYIEFVEYQIGEEIFFDEHDYSFGDTITLDLSKHLHRFNTKGKNVLRVIIQDVYGNRSNAKTFTFYFLDLSLESTIKNIVKIDSKAQTFIYNFTAYGGNVDTGSDLRRYILLKLSSLDSPNEYIIKQETDFTTLGNRLQAHLNLTDNGNPLLEHNVYLLTATYCVEIKDTGLIIESNDLMHQIACVDSANEIPLIASNFVDKVIPQYSKLVLEYMIALGETVKDDEAKILIENDAVTEKIQLNTINTWIHTFYETGSYTISIEYGGVPARLGVLTISSYGDENIPVIDTATAELNLTPRGKSNTSTERSIWEWTNPSTNEVYSSNFEGFLWGNENGWIADSDGQALKLSNGAKLTIPNYKPFSHDPIAEDGMTIELDFKLSNILDYNKPLISCLSYNLDENGNKARIACGFHITGQKATLNSANCKATQDTIDGGTNDDGFASAADMALQSFTQHFNEDIKIHLTYVIQPKIDGEYNFVYTYLNGVLSGIMEILSSESFKENGPDPAILTFDSTYGDIYLYSIRTYRYPLNADTVINNYLADIEDMNKKISLYKQNKIFNDYNKVSKKAIDNLSCALGVPYVIFEGGIQMHKQFKPKKLKEEGEGYINGYPFSDLTPALPLRKDDYRLMSMKMYEKNEDGSTKTLLDIPIGLGKTENEEDATEIIRDFNDIVKGEPYWFYQGVQVYGQGTSSMVYPVKNLRLRFIKKSDYPVVYDESVPVEIVCFKADYMDSSSSHNTCTGNLVYDLYKNMGLKTPPQIFGGDYDIVTAIKGFPIICFYKDYNDDDAEEDYLYIGRYNFNLDKATPEPFGFPGQYKYDDTELDVPDEQGRLRKVVKACGVRTEIVDGKTVLPLDEEGKEIVEDIVQCWEFLNNDTNSPTKFLNPDKSKYSNYEAALRDAWDDYYEDRYPDEIVGLKEDGELDDTPWAKQALEEGLFRMSLWVNSTSTDVNEITNQPLASEIYYKTLDKTPSENTKYYSAPGEEVEIIKTDAINISTGGTAEAPIDVTKISVSLEVFKSKVKTYGTYTFTYLSNNWYLYTKEGNELVNLIDYGILLSEENLLENQSIIIDLLQVYDGWSTSLLEKHTHDNAKYRLAKFKNEFTQYFNMDFCLFYYLVTLILLMMDSRAKNMMLASWDTKIWYPIFYDMDTMLGLNNTGFNKFSYDTEDDPADKVFNGFDSVLWNNFKTCFYPEIAQFYSKLRTIGGLNLEKLLEIYNENGADAWCEALTTADTIYKHERPYKEGYYDGKDKTFIEPGTISYLYAAQGKRSNHRAWWLKNRFDFLDSKFLPENLGNTKPSQSDTISFRAYALPSQQSNAAAQECIQRIPANHQFDLTALSKSYQSLFIGNIVYGPVYAEAGETVKVGPTSPKHEVESYILNPNLIADLGDLSDKYIGSWNMPKNKLTELKFGQSSRSHPDTYKYYFNSLLNSLNLSTNVPYLTNLNVARCIGLITLDLTYCTRLKVLDAEQSKLTSIVFPKDSVIEQLYLPNTLTQLELVNQAYLDEIIFDEGDLFISNFILDNVSNYNSYALAKKVFKNTQNEIKFTLKNINWIATDLEGEIIEGYDKKVLTSIPILDVLIDDTNFIKPSGQLSLADALTGTLLIDGDFIANEFDIYKKYKKYFPNLNIIYSSNVDLIKGYKINFVIDEINKIHYSTLAPADNSLSIANLISSSGPNGVALTSPERILTVDKEYNFSGYWKNGEEKYYDKNNFNGEIEPTATDLSTVIPKNDMEFKADYISTPRFYLVRFHDDEGTILEETNIEYNTIYNGQMTNFYYKEIPDTPENENLRYKFVGWATARVENPIIFNIETTPITSNINLYAYYEIESVTEVSSYEYFDISQESGESVLSLGLKEKYKTILQGKITIPAKSKSGREILKIKNNGFLNNTLITHIYFEEGSIYDTIGGSAFAIDDDNLAITSASLKYIGLPNTIRYIKENAFNRQIKLENANLNNDIISIGSFAFGTSINMTNVKHHMCLKLENGLPEKLEELGEGAFFRGGPNIKITLLPEKLKEVKSNTFTDCAQVAIREFGSADVSNSSALTQIATGAFARAGLGRTDVTEIIFNQSIGPNSFGTSCFSGSYAGRDNSQNPRLSTITFMNPNITIENVDAILSDAELAATTIELVKEN